MVIKDFLRILFYPVVLLRRAHRKYKIQYYLKNGNLKDLADYHFLIRLGKHIDWVNPKDINEKIQWLKFYGDTSLWPIVADKYAVRDFVTKRGCNDLLVKLYGHWESADDIDFDSLPNQFVLKVNNGSGDVLCCKDKNQLNYNEVRNRYGELLKSKFWSLFAEPHYSKIKPCIIAEELLDCSKQPIRTSTLIDYKVWCFDGKPAYIWTCYNRTPKTVEVALYDLDWNYHPEKSVFTDHYIKATQLLPKPNSLNRMLDAAAALSKGFPQVRVDFYEIDNKVYFGEMTLTAKGGYMDFYTKDFLLELGSKVDLNNK